MSLYVLLIIGKSKAFKDHDNRSKLIWIISVLLEAPDWREKKIEILLEVHLFVCFQN